MKEIITTTPASESKDETKKFYNEDDKIVEQLHNPEKIKVGNNEITTYEASPKPEKLKSEFPVLFGAGLLQDGEKQRELMFQLAKLGRRSLSYTALHGIEDNDIKPELTKDLPKAEIRKIAALMATLDKKEIKKTDFVGHSEGGIIGLIAASVFPERFRSVIVDSPVLIKKNDTPLKLIKRFSMDLASGISQDLKKNKPDWVEKIGQKLGVAGDIYDSPWSKSVQEMRFKTGTDRKPSEHKQSLSLKKLWEEINAISNIKMEKLLPNLKKQGINIVISYGVDDKTTPGEHIQSTIKADEVAGLYSMHGGHSTIYWAPKKYAHLIDHTLTSIEKGR